VIRRTWAVLLAAAIYGMNGHAQVPAHHTFLLTKTPEGCHIVTEEVVKGPGAIRFREQQPNAMHEGHQLWLTTLKDRSEKH